MITTSPVRRLRDALALSAGALALLSPAGAAAAGCSPTTDAYAQAVLADTPSAYYRLDEAGGTAICDSSSVAANGTYASGVQYGVAGALSSTSDTAVGAADPSSGIGSGGAGVTGNHSFTLEAWFRSGGTTQNQALVAMGTAATGQIAGLTTWSNVDTTTYGADAGTKGASEIGLDTYSSSNHWDTSPVGVNIWDGQWHQLAVTYDQAANQVVAYADGNPLPAETPSTTLNLGAGSILVGNWVDHDLNKPLLGNEDEAAVYGSALSASRIAAHFQSAAGSPPAPSPTPTPPGGKHATGLSVSCTYSVATSADTCTALVGDASTDATAGQPTGTVSFASPRGLFTLGTTCNLASSPTSPSVASCSVNYLPPDMYLPTITATYNGDGQHASSSGHTQYRGANAASTYESVPTPAPNAFSKQITVSTPVSADGSSATACVLSAVPGAYAAGGTERQSAALSVAELQALTRQVDQAVANVNVAVSESLQRSTGGLLQRIFNGLPADSQQRADVLRMPFFGDIGGDIGKLMRDGLPPVQPIIQQIGNLFVGDVVDSIPADPQARAEDLSQNAVRNLLDDIARIENAESARCSATSASQRAVGAVAAKRKSRRSPLARTTRKGIKAGRLKLTLHLSKRRLAKLTAHRKSARLAVVINLTMPSDLMPKGYPRAVVELVTLHRGKRHKQH